MNCLFGSLIRYMTSDRENLNEESTVERIYSFVDMAYVFGIKKH